MKKSVSSSLRTNGYFSSGVTLARTHYEITVCETVMSYTCARAKADVFMTQECLSSNSR